jgi:hypothetical protein
LSLLFLISDFDFVAGNLRPIRRPAFFVRVDGFPARAGSEMQ